MDLGFAQKCAVVTGGSSGIGLETTRILLNEGAKVAICGRDENRLMAAQRDLVGAVPSSRLLAVRCDVTDEKSVIAFASQVSSWTDKLDLFVSNAGEGRVSTFATTSNAEWRDELNLKFFSQILPIKAFMHLLLASETPAIVGVNSLLALQPEPHMVCTAAARAGVQNFLKSLSVELAPKIRVNSVLLGLVESGQWERRFERRSNVSLSREEWLAGVAEKKEIPLRRLGKPDEAARAIVFLGSQAASYITGASLEVSGGVSHHF